MAQAEAATPKICVVCKEGCSGKPRAKDLQGRYTCKACLQKQQAAPKPAARPAPKPAPAPDLADADFMSSLIDQSPTAASAPGGGAKCDGCGMPMHPGAVVCMACGYNAQTGKKMGMKIT